MLWGECLLGKTGPGYRRLQWTVRIYFVLTANANGSVGNYFINKGNRISLKIYFSMDGWMNQAYSRLSTTLGHITDCKLLVCMYCPRLVLVRPAISLYSASPLKHHPTGKQ